MAGLLASGLNRRPVLPYLGQAISVGVNQLRDRALQAGIAGNDALASAADNAYEEGSPLDVGIRTARPVVGSIGRGLVRGLGGAAFLNSLTNPGALLSAGLTGLSAGGRYLTSRPPEEPLGDTARRMGMIEGENPRASSSNVSGGGPGADTDSSTGGSTGGSNTASVAASFPENGMFPEYKAYLDRNAAASSRPATRAIRLPGGKFLFTNREEYGGEEFSPAEAGRQIRSAEATPSNVRMAEAPRIDPTSATMSALVRSSIRASRGERSPGSMIPQPAGRMTEGTTPDVSGGAVSMIEGTPEQQIAVNFQRALGAASLAGVEQERKVNEMDPAAAALLGNPQVQAGSWALNALLPRIDAANAAAAKLADEARRTITDPKQLQQELRRIEDERRNTLLETQSILAVLLGIRPQQL